MKNFISILIISLVLIIGCQNSNIKEDGLVKLVLKPSLVGEKPGLRWSPKGEKLILQESEAGLKAELFLGPEGLAPINILLSDSNKGGQLDQLAIDMDRDGQFDGTADTLLSCTPNDSRGKTWSSFSAVVTVPFSKMKGQKAVVNSYPLSFWYVFDPQEPDADPVIRFSRRGWMEGQTETEFGTIRVLLTERMMDGVFNSEDSWAISMDSSRTDLFQSKSAKSVATHNWLGEQAYGIDSLLPSGRVVWIKPVDPQITRAEEERQSDWLAPDKAAKRSGSKVNFMHEFDYARDLAKQRGHNLFIDFETTWCGPCKTMDQWVYTADTVISASKSLVCVKVDGDDHRDLVKKFDVSGYPTLILVSPSGEILKKVSGYQSVIKTINFMK